MRVMIIRLLFFLAIIFISSCDSFTSPTGLSETGGVTLSAWKPCVIVHSPGFPGNRVFENQMQAVEKLQKAGRLEWFRIGEANIHGGARDYAVRAKRMGLKTIAIIPTHDLELNPLGWEDTYRTFKHLYGSLVDIWQIGGEIQNPDPTVNLVTMTPEEYMRKFRNLYRYIKERYPSDMITNAPTFGSGYGAEELQRFIEAGLLDIETDQLLSRNLIIAVHIYTSNVLRDYGKVFNRYQSQLARKRVWVTETGVDGDREQVEWVNKTYPIIINTLHPEMICWYALYAGDPPEAVPGAGLIYNVDNGLPVVERELFKRLTGEIR
jgi:hypothetical protein